MNVEYNIPLIVHSRLSTCEVIKSFKSPNSNNKPAAVKFLEDLRCSACLKSNSYSEIKRNKPKSTQRHKYDIYPRFLFAGNDARKVGKH